MIRLVNRQQMSWRAVDVEKLIGEDHAARAIWTLVGRLDLSEFYQGIESSAEEGGRPAFDPQLLISLWVYAYSQGIGSAREVARRCEYDPAFQWLTGLEEVNYHTLADFRVEKQKELDELFTQVLGVLSKEGLVTLEEVMQDGTKIAARASGSSFHREKTLREHLERARRQVEALRDPGAEVGEKRKQAARERAARESEERLEKALVELEHLREVKPTAEEKREARVSGSDPEARVMKQADGGFRPGYNAQISTESKNGFVVAVEVTQAGNDYQQLLPAVERIEQRWQRKPGRMVVDAGYTSGENIQGMAERGIDLVGSLADDAAKARNNQDRRFAAERFTFEADRDRYVCPAGKPLTYEGSWERGGSKQYKYKAAREDCDPCSMRASCCGENRKQSRSVIRKQESAAMSAFRRKMASEEAQAIYRRRGPVSEFVHAWIKSKLGLRQYHVRGLNKVRTETLWACFTYNLQQWIRLSRAPAGVATS